VRPGLDGAAYAYGGQECVAQRYFVLCLAPSALMEMPPGAPAPPRRRFLVSVREVLNWDPDAGQTSPPAGARLGLIAIRTD
jgi:hypothetical protein